MKKAVDSTVLRKQPIAHSGVYEYQDGMKLQRWEDLKRNIGRTVPVTDEHPDPENGNFGMVSGKEKVWGKAAIYGDDSTETLFAVLDLDDGAPVKDGYSKGFLFIPVDEPGEFKGKAYDQIQSMIIIDHVALVTEPRDWRALQLVGDHVEFTAKLASMGLDSVSTRQYSPSTDRVLKYAFAHDTHEFDDPEKDKIRDLILKDNPTMPDAEIVARVEMAYKNRKKLKSNEAQNMPEPIKKEEPAPASDGKPSSKELDLVAKVAQLEAQIASDGKARDLEAKLKQAEERESKLKETIAAQDAKAYSEKIATITKKTGCDGKVFNGVKMDEAGKGYINGWFDAMTHLSLGADTGKEVSKPTKTDEEKPATDAEMVVGYDSTDMVYDHAKKMMVDPEGFPYGHKYQKGHVFKERDA